jgi:molybdopterin synthase sulfur carrier subunit
VPQVQFTQNLLQHIDAPARDVPAETVREALEHVFGEHPALRSYVLDDQGRLRKHVVVFVDGRQVKDRQGLSDPLQQTSEVFVMQALSGG